VKKNGYPAVPRFLQVPWWLSVLLAILSYSLLKYLVPQLQFPGGTIKNMALFAPRLAPLAAIFFLLLAAIRLYDSDDNDRPDDQEGKESFDR